MPKSIFPLPLSKQRMTGILLKPMERPNDLALAVQAHGTPRGVHDEVWELKENFITNQKLERLTALAKHYSINLNEANAVVDLALRLAADFIVGFRFEDDPLIRSYQRGRKKGTTDFPPHVLAHRVWQLIDSGLSASAACKALAKERRTPWKGKTARALLQNFNRYVADLKKRKSEFDSHPLYSSVQSFILPHKSK